MHAPATAVFGYSSIASLSLWTDGRRVCARASAGVTNRFAPLNEGELFTRWHRCLLARGEEKAGNDSGPKHSCVPTGRPMCVWAEIAIGSGSPASLPPQFLRPLPSLNLQPRKRAYERVLR